MIDLASFPAAWMPLIIFVLRVASMSFDTLRVLYVIRGRRTLAWTLGFFQSVLWVIAIGGVFSDLGNLLNMAGYAAGFATGNVVGMAIEERLALGHAHMRIISPKRGSAIADAIRRAGYAATELPGRGKDGTVSVISCSVRRRDVDRVRQETGEIDPQAFITVEDIQPLHRGYWRA